MITIANKALNIYELFNLLTENEVILVYQGMFDQQMIKTVLSMTEIKMEQVNVDENVRKKVFNIMMEGLQNICKHQKPSETHSQNPFLIISSSGTYYHIFTGNIIVNNKISIVKDKIDHINTLDKEGLKSLYKTARLNSVISEVGGAGLGFIDMARKSENKLEYLFYPLDNNQSFFILHSKITNK